MQSKACLNSRYKYNPVSIFSIVSAPSSQRCRSPVHALLVPSVKRVYESHIRSSHFYPGINRCFYSSTHSLHPTFLLKHRFVSMLRALECMTAEILFFSYDPSVIVPIRIHLYMIFPAETCFKLQCVLNRDLGYLFPIPFMHIASYNHLVSRRYC